MDVRASRQVYANPWLSVREDTVGRPDGTTGAYAVVAAADIALVVPVDGERVCLVEQYRHPVGGRRWELPSGSLAAGETPAECAARELREETGLVASDLTELGVLEVLPSTLDQRCRVFLATGLEPGQPDPDPEEHDLRSAWFTRAQLETMLGDGSVTDARTLAAYLLLDLHERP